MDNYLLMNTGKLYNNDFFNWLFKAHKRRRKFLYRSMWYQLQSLGCGQEKADKAHIQLVRSKAVVILNPLMPNTTVQGKIRFMPNQDLVRRIKKEGDSQSILSQVIKPIKILENNEADSIKFTTEENKFIHDFHSKSKFHTKEQSSRAPKKSDPNADNQDLVRRIKKEVYDSQSILSQITKPIKKLENNEADSIKFTTEENKYIHDFHSKSKFHTKEQSSQAPMKSDPNADTKHNLVLMSNKEDCQITYELVGRRKSLETETLQVQKESINLSTIHIIKNDRVKQRINKMKLGNFDPKFSLLSARVKRLTNRTFFRNKWQTNFCKQTMKFFQFNGNLDKVDETVAASTVFNELYSSRLSVASMSTVANHSHYSKLDAQLDQTDETHSVSTVLFPPSRQPCLSMKNVAGKSYDLKLLETNDTASTVINPHVRPKLLETIDTASTVINPHVRPKLLETNDTASTVINPHVRPKLLETNDTASTVINPHVRPSKTNKTQYPKLGALRQEKFDTARTIVNSQCYDHPSNYQRRYPPFSVPKNPSTRRGGQSRYRPNNHRRGWQY